MKNILDMLAAWGTDYYELNRVKIQKRSELFYRFDSHKPGTQK